MEIDIKIQGKHPEVGLYDCGSELVCISEMAAKEMGLLFSSDMQLHMRDANGGSRATFGIIENLQLDIGGVAVYVHAWIIKNAPYRVLLGRPFQIAAQADTEDIGTTLVLEDPSRPGFKLRVPMRPHKNLPHTPPSCNFLLGEFATLTAASLSVLSTPQTPSLMTPLIASTSISGRVFDSLPTPTLLSAKSPFAARYFREIYEFSPSVLGLKCKPVDRKVRPVATTMPEDAIPKRHFPEDPLLSLPLISYTPPQISNFGSRLTEERWNNLKIDRDFLSEEELKLAFLVLMNNETALAWDDSERGTFREDYFEPVIIPTIEHEPWALKNIPIPPGLKDEVVKFIKMKIDSGVYEPSGSSYRSRWFCVPKKNGKFRIVHDLQPLNAVTIKDAGIPPNIEPYAEHCAGRSIYTMGDLYVGYDHAPIAERSRDLTTFQTPLGPHRLTCLPMGWSNSVSVFQGHVTFILQDEIEIAPPFLDDIPILGPKTRYERTDGTYETILVYDISFGSTSRM